MRDIIFELKVKLTESVERNRAAGLLFSGGLDSAVLAAINPRPKAISVSLKSYGEDIRYSNSVARFLSMKHFHKSVDTEEVMEAIPEVVKILKSFDLAIPNDIVVYFGLKYANEIGIKEVMTGDGSDELFGGYSFMQKKDDLGAYIKKISQKMSFSSNELGDFFNIEIKQPFMDKKIIDLALKIPTTLKIKRENSRLHGKWILRKAFEDILPEEIAWQDKRALEHGSGMTKIREIVSSKVCDEEFKKVSKTSSIKFMSKEHYYYYKIYRNVVGEIPKPERGEKKCLGCGTGMGPGDFHCKLCGNILDWRL